MSLGRYYDIEEALDVYLRFKLKVFEELVEIYRDEIDIKVLNKLLNINKNNLYAFNRLWA
jgi:hypothetical protein